MEPEFKSRDEVVEFFRNRHGFMTVSRICDLLVTHQNVQAQEIEEIKRHLHRLKTQGHVLVENEGQDIYHERFASTTERVENYFNQRTDNQEGELAQMSEEELLQIIRRNENPDVPGSRHQQAVQELALRDRARNIEKDNVAPKWWKNPLVTVPAVIALLALIVPVGMWLWDKHFDIPKITVADVQYELVDDNGSVIHRRTWLGNELLDADAKNISRMVLSIKLKNPGGSRVAAIIKNEKEIYAMPYVVNALGEFQSQHYPIPANGETGFIFGIDITPFTQLTLLSTSTDNTQNIKIYDESGIYLETVESNIVKTYGMNIPYVIEVLNDDGKRLDEFEFNVLCRAKIGELRATLDTSFEGIDGKISKSLNFECHPTFEPDVL